MSDTWPDYLPLPKEHFHAVGVLTSVFNSLEQQVLFLMLPYFGVGQTTVFLFNRIRDNGLRVDLLKRVSAERAETPEIADAITHFCDGFSLCSQNRNVIMHSITTGASQKGDAIQTTLRKFALKSGEWNEYSVSLSEIKGIADDTFRFDRYGGRIFRHVVGNFHREFVKPPGAIPPGQPLPDKPPLPTCLIPQLPQDPKDD